MNSMDEWDRTRACLQSIEGNARWIARYCEDIKLRAANLEAAMKNLTERPDFETRARDELGTTAETLQLTLALVRSACEIYDRTPVTVQAEAAE